MDLPVQDFQKAAAVVVDILQVAVGDIVQVELKDNYCSAFFDTNRQIEN